MSTWLKQLKNNFIEFKPTLWNISVDTKPQVVRLEKNFKLFSNLVFQLVNNKPWFYYWKTKWGCWAQFKLNYVRPCCYVFSNSASLLNNLISLQPPLWNVEKPIQKKTFDIKFASIIYEICDSNYSKVFAKGS